MSKGTAPEVQRVETQPSLDNAALPRATTLSAGAAVEPTVELSGSSFKFKLDPAQRHELSARLREPLKPSLSATLSRTQGKLAAAGRKFSLRNFFRLESGRTVIDGLLSIATAILKLLDKILMFLLRSRTPILTRLILPSSTSQLEGLSEALTQKKKKAPGRDGAAMV